MQPDLILPTAEQYLLRAERLKRELLHLPIGTANYECVVDQIIRLEERARERRVLEARRRASGFDRRRF